MLKNYPKNFWQAPLADLPWAGLPDEVEAVVISVADVWLPPSPKAGERFFPERMPASMPKRVQAVRALTKARFWAVQARRRVQADFPAWDVCYEACAASPAWAVIKKAWEWQPDLVVVGSRGHSALGRFIHGSVSQTVVTEARCSVRVVRDRAGQHDSPVRVVIGVDGSPSAEAVVQAVTARRWPAGSELRVITVIDPALSTATTLFLPTVRRWVTESQKKEDAWLYKMAEAAAKKLEAAGLTVSFCVKEGDPKRVLIEETERWEADCIFVGARGLSSLKWFFLGSVSTAVAMGARCSVEVVRPSERPESVLRLNGQRGADRESQTRDLTEVSA
jgi:nucleotide-binding universal stress UspA family protein